MIPYSRFPIVTTMLQVNRILRYDNADTYAAAGKAFPQPAVISTNLPQQPDHGWRYIRQALQHQTQSCQHACRSQGASISSVLPAPGEADTMRTHALQFLWAPAASHSPPVCKQAQACLACTLGPVNPAVMCLRFVYACPVIDLDHMQATTKSASLKTA
jgi:hypothetical protein